MKLAIVTILSAALLTITPAHSAEPTVQRTREVSRAMDFLTALGKLDFSSAGSLLDDEAVLDLPFAGKGLTIKGREEVMRFFQRSMKNSVGTIDYALNQTYPSQGGRTVILELSTRGQTATGRDYTNRLITIFRFRHDRIILFREYFNPVSMDK